MTERGHEAVDRSATHLRIGSSGWSCAGEDLVIDIDEWTVPIPRRLKGRITVRPGPIFHEAFPLDEAGRHTWRPIAPCASVEVAFDKPGLSWRGRAYVDMNAGSEEIEAGFSRWNWSREEWGLSTRIHYDVVPRTGARRHLALEYRADGTSSPVVPAPLHTLSRTGWRVTRDARGPGDQPAKVLRTLEDTPFYSRSMLGGEGGSLAIHETVDLDRFRSRWVQVLLPFKMPRWTRWSGAKADAKAGAKTSIPPLIAAPD